MRTLAELQAECAALGIFVLAQGRASKEPYIAALREHHWRAVHANAPVPAEVRPMLLGDWHDLTEDEAERIERDESGWVVQPKMDGIRAILHVSDSGVRLTGRCISDVTYRLGEFHENLPHLATGLSLLKGTILDGELVCPVAHLDTGSTTTAHPLQAATAILATDPANARNIQESQSAHLHFHAFDVIRFKGTIVTGSPLHHRLAHLPELLTKTDNPYLHLVPTVRTKKVSVHEQVLAAGGEGTVWKQDYEPYEPGRRVRHWLKRKRAVEVEAFVSGGKPGSADRGNAALIGAVEFGACDLGGPVRSIAWVSSWTDADRRAMTDTTDCTVRLNPAYIGRRALIAGHDYSSKAGRLRHARFVRWLDPEPDRREMS